MELTYLVSGEVSQASHLAADEIMVPELAERDKKIEYFSGGRRRYGVFQSTTKESWHAKLSALDKDPRQMPLRLGRYSALEPKMIRS